MNCIHKKYLAYVENLEQRLKKNPNDYDALLRKGVIICDSLQRYDESAILLDTLIEHYPDNIAAYYWQAECLGYSGDIDRIKSVLDRGLMINPHSAECHYLLAQVLIDFDPCDPLIDVHYKQAIALQPTWPAPRYYFMLHLIKKNLLSDAKKELDDAMQNIGEILPVPEDLVEYLYETFITGRCSFDNNDFINKLQQLEYTTLQQST